MRQDRGWQVGASGMPPLPDLGIGVPAPAHAHLGAVGKTQGASVAVPLQSQEHVLKLCGCEDKPETTAA